MTSTRTLLDFVFYQWIAHQMDVKNTNSNGWIEDEAFMEKGIGFVELDKENIVCKF
jgi:hypothetical protein